MYLHVCKHYVENTKKWEGEKVGACSTNMGSCPLNIKHKTLKQHFGMGSFSSFQPDSDQKTALLASNNKWGKCAILVF